ncbi:DUF4175 family protein [Arcicella aquatica]|uniref:DUF4175 family protein n=1 Tax=Arcicella aquatica TaxID=217141 RepID=A0ABU5QQR8_9BACT|nr:hypothetical protein [Arcicella aquatica]MEA5259074.1 DUF4175 family protein [Arcicella aquatica]
MNQLKQIITKVKIQLYFMAGLMCLLVAGSAYFCLLLLLKSSALATVGFVVVLLVMAFITKLFQNKSTETIHLIHQKIENTEYSLELLAIESPNLAQQLQLERLFSQDHYQTPWVFKKNLIAYFAVFMLSWVCYAFVPSLLKKQSQSVEAEKQSASHASQQISIPVFTKAKLIIQAPAYTGLSIVESQNMNASAIVGSLLKWQIQFSNTEHLSVKLVNNQGDEIAFNNNKGLLEHSDQILSSGLYAFKAYWNDSLIYQSDYYRLEAIPDLAPKIEPASKELYKLHYLKDPKNVQISAKISDDFLVSQAFIVATLARGSGENVKFREVKIPITNANFKQTNVIKNIDLKALNFAPGDELYYYWAAFDNKRPTPNYTKSDTYFIVYKDTTQVEEADLATMAMNIMPEYFRSQRQIIIDTEKLIAKRKKLPAKEFNSTSNEIGFDQKALRLRYGQYLGEEFENSIGSANALPNENEAGGDLLKGFRHAHDEGEHDQEAGEKHEEHDHGGNKPDTDNKDPLAGLLADYVHSHDDGEANTFYEQSTRSLLKMALEQMWQSELHLRMYEPEKAIPFEKKALEYLKSAQHKARTFVKKTSFDPPPIKEKEKRLTGELTKFNEKFSFEKNYSQLQIESLVAEVIGIASTKAENQKLSVQNKQKVLLLSTIMSSKIINSSLNNWSILTALQKMINDKDLSKAETITLQNKLYQLLNKTLPTKNNLSSPSYLGEKKLEKAFWKNVSL